MKENLDKLYLEYVEKYKNFNIKEGRLKYIEDVSRKEYKKEMGLNKEMYIRMNLYFDVLSQLYNDIDKLDVINQYKTLVSAHSKNITKYISQEEVDIIFDDTIEYVKQNYNKEEALGSYIVSLFKNNLVDYVNENYNLHFTKIKGNEIKISR